MVSLNNSRMRLYGSNVSLLDSRGEPPWQQGEPLKLFGKSPFYKIESPRLQGEPLHLEG
jgi:hypothetical protein